MYLGVVCFHLLAILVITECGVVNIICRTKEDEVFDKAENITADYVQFRLYTRSNREDFKLLANRESIQQSPFDPYLQTIFIVHGYQSSPGSSGFILLKEFTLMHDDFNIIIVDWSMGASEEYMPHAIRNAVASAREVASFIELLVETSGTTLSHIHLIGFSLGAQLVSFVGKQLDKIGRITALDPAGPCFSLYSNNHRIHFTDAEFVDVIITNGDGLGLKRPTGHVNFVVNGGETQSECGAVVLQKFRDSHSYQELYIDSCSHHRALQLYTDSLKNENCEFVGYSCSSYEAFLKGECTDCGEDGDKCALLGYKAIEYIPKIRNETKVFYLKAASDSPYCLHHYAVSVKIKNSNDSEGQTGKLYIALDGRHEETMKLLNQIQETFEPGKEYRYLLTLPTDIKHLNSVKLLWIRTSGGSYDIHWLYVDSVKISLMNGSKDSHSIVFKSCARLPLFSGIKKAQLFERKICERAVFIRRIH